MSSSVTRPAATAASQQLDPIFCSSNCIELSPASSRSMGRSQQSLIAGAITDVTSQAMTNARALDGQNYSRSINLEHGCQLRCAASLIPAHPRLKPYARPQRKRIRLVLAASGLAGAGDVAVAPARAE